MLVFSISPILAPSVGSLVVQFGDWRKIFWVMAISGVLSLVLAVFGPEGDAAGRGAGRELA